MSFSLRQNVSMVPTEYGAVLFDQKGGEYWTLNETGELILKVLLEGGAVTEAAQRLMDTFDITLDEATTDVTALLTEFQDCDLLRGR